MHKLEKIRIQIYEESLPSDIHLAKAAVFELRCPPAFAKYRDTTLMLISKLASPEVAVGVAPKCLLNGYYQLNTVANIYPKFTLASLTKSCMFFLGLFFVFVIPANVPKSCKPTTPLSDFPSSGKVDETGCANPTG